MGKVDLILARGWLLIVVSWQVMLTPLLVFSATYIFEFSADVKSGLTINPHFEMFPWVISVTVVTALLALFLSLFIGGCVPLGLVERGGLLSGIGLGRTREAEHVSQAQIRFRQSPHGNLVRIVHGRALQKHRLLESHGALQMVAAPFQLGLALVPLVLVVMLPTDWMVAGRLFELILLSYIGGLVIAMKAFPIWAEWSIGLAQFTRRWFMSVASFSSLLPLLLLWGMAEGLDFILVEWLSADMPHEQFVFEQRWLEAMIGSPVTVPESSFLDLLVALAIIPMSTFITISTMVGGDSSLPSWATEPVVGLKQGITLEEMDEMAIVNKLEGLVKAKLENASVAEDNAETTDAGIESSTDEGKVPKLEDGGLPLGLDVDQPLLMDTESENQTEQS